MGKENLRGTPAQTEAASSKDPYLHEDKNGGALVDLIHISWVDSRSAPYLAQGVACFQGTLLGFRAFGELSATYAPQVWSIYVPFAPQELVPLPGFKPYTEEDWERLKKQFPQAFPLENVDYEKFVADYQLPEHNAQRYAFTDLVHPAIKKAEQLCPRPRKAPNS